MDTTTVTLSHAVFEKGDVVFYEGEPFVVVSASGTSVTLRPARLSRLYFIALAVIFCLIIAAVVLWFLTQGETSR